MDEFLDLFEFIMGVKGDENGCFYVEENKVKVNEVDTNIGGNDDF